MISGVYKYHPRDLPIPEGWHYVCQLAGQHAYYCFLIKKTVKFTIKTNT